MFPNFISCVYKKCGVRGSTLHGHVSMREGQHLLFPANPRRSRDKEFGRFYIKQVLMHKLLLSLSEKLRKQEVSR